MPKLLAGDSAPLTEQDRLGEARILAWETIQMGKSVGLVVVAVALVLGLWWYAATRSPGVQGDPASTVTAFMTRSAAMSSILWDEDTQQELKDALDQWRQDDEGEEAERARKTLKEYGIEEVSPLFKDEDYARAASGGFCFYYFDQDSFAIVSSAGREEAATVEVAFQPKDVFGLNRAISALGVPGSSRQPEPMIVPFRLKKHRSKWYIEDIGGQVGKAVSAVKLLQRSK